MYGVLTEKEIRECMAKPLKDRLFISPLLDAEQIGDTTIDLRLGQHFLVPKTSKLGIIDVIEMAQNDLSETQIARCYGRVRVPLGGYFTLHPGSKVHVSSLEYIGMPNYLQGDITLRHKFSSIPIMASTAKVHPGFRGSITLSLINNAPFSIKLYPGLRFAQIELRWLSQAIVAPRRSQYAVKIAPYPIRIHKDRDIRKLGPTVEPLIIGIVSTIAAGRTTVIAHLEKHEFIVFRLSEVLRSEALKRGISPLRQQLQSLGNELRELRGNGFLAQYLRNSQRWLNNKHPYVIVDGFKHPEEVREFQKQERFVLIGIDASEEVRKQRTIQGRRTGDPLDENDFLEADSRDRGLVSGLSQHHQMVDKVLEMVESHNLIVNDSTPEELYRKLDELISRIRQYG